MCLYHNYSGKNWRSLNFAIYLQNACMSLILTDYKLMDWSSTIQFHVIINGDSGCTFNSFIWSKVPCIELALQFYARMDSFHRKKLQCQREEANQQHHYAVVIVKRTAGCTENRGSWPWGNEQHVYFFSKVRGLQ